MITKLLIQTKKNFKRLARSKLAASLIIFGPLVLIALLGLAFQTEGFNNIKIGIYEKGNQELSEEITKLLEYNDFEVIRTDDQDACTRGVLSGRKHVCMVFPTSFEEDDMEFYVDYSRMNLVYSLIEVLKREISTISDEIGLDITEELLTTMSQTNTQLLTGLREIQAFDQKMSALNQELQLMQQTISSTQNFDSELIKQLADEDSDINKDIEEAKDELDLLERTINSNKQEAQIFREALEESEESLQNTLNNNCEGIVYEDKSEELETDGFTWQVSENYLCSLTYTLLNSIKVRKEVLDENIRQMNDIESKVVNTQRNLNNYHSLMQDESARAESGMEELSSGKDDLTRSFSNLNEELIQGRSQLHDVTTGFESALSEFEQYDFLDAQNIITPVSTAIKSVDNEERNTLDFIFPALIVMIIMFVGILIGNILVMKEKTSPAYFRNLILPASSWFSIIGIYITSMFVVFLQTIVLFIAGIYMFNSNIIISPEAIIVIIITSIIFISIGMFIGYLSNSAEIGILVAISTTIIFMTLSNFIVPTELMSQHMAIIARFTPFSISEVFLRRYLIYGPEMASVGLNYVLGFLLTLLTSIGLVYGSQKLSTRRI